MEINGEQGMVVKRNGTRYKIDFNKVNSIEDIIIVLKALDIYFRVENADSIPESMQEMFNSSFLTEVN